MVPGDEGLVIVGYDQLLQVTQRIRRARGPVLVVARARQDTYRAGPLYVDLDARPVSTGAATGN